MKQKDIAIVIAVGVVSAILALVISNMFIGASAHKQEAEVADRITADFQAADERYFNSESVDPTRPITIGDNSNQTPFKQTQ